MRKCVKSLESVLKTEKVWESVLKNEKLWESVLKVEKLWQSVPKMSEILISDCSMLYCVRLQSPPLETKFLLQTAVIKLIQ